MIFAGKPPSNLGVTDGKLAPCKRSPNCVSSQASDEQHFIDPIRVDTAEASDEFARLIRALQSMPRIRVITERQDYVHAECKTKLMGFVDDLELYLDAEAGQVHVRSCARLGYRDFGVNRDRVETLRKAFAEAK